MMYRLMLCVVCVALIGCLGCSLFDQHAREFDVMRGMAATAADRLADGAVSQYQVSGQALNPGVVVEAAVVYRALARYEGLAGQFGASAQGQLGATDNKALTDALYKATQNESLTPAITRAIDAAVAKALGTDKAAE